MRAVYKKFIAVVLVAAFAVTGAACQKSAGSGGNSMSTVLSPFESYVPDITLIRMSETFGRISLNSDKRYVKSGEHSVKVQPLGPEWMWIPTYSEHYDFDYTDFSRVDCVVTDVYNPGESATVRVGLVSGVESVTVFSRIAEQSFTLGTGWNTLRYYIDPSAVGLQNADLSDIEGVYYAFSPDVTASDVSDDTAAFYFDKTTLLYRSSPHPAPERVTFADGEILNFEHAYDKYFIANDFNIEMGIVRAADYGLDAPGGTKVLRLVLPAENSGIWRYYLKITGSCLNAGALGKLTAEEFDRATLKWDSYSNYNSSFNVVTMFNVGTSLNNSYANANFPKYHEWTTHEVKLTDIVEAVPGWRDNMGTLVFSVKADAKEERELFFDNFRVELS